ncbi:MAG: hypothetical protein Q4G58_16450 [bacterium]|nr:hypothetical protein [bacterium]
MHNTAEELQQQLEGMQIYKSYQHRLASIREEIRVLRSQLLALEDSCKKEDQDVEELKKSGLQAFYLKVRGKYEETMDREILEAAAAKVKYENKQFELEDAQKREYSLQVEAMQYCKCEMNYKNLYERRLQELLAEDNGAKVELLDYKSKLTNSEHNKKELKEAITAGRRVKSELERVEQSLDSARSYGTWDIMGGGLVADAMKHSSLDDAKSRLRTVQSLMREFRTELADVRMSFDIQINTDGFAKFADFWFDGLFADWNMQNKINDARNNVITSKQKVESIIHRLEQLHRQEESAIHEYQRRIDDIVNSTK